jgi:hypothetical protein
VEGLIYALLQSCLLQGKYVDLSLDGGRWGHLVVIVCSFSGSRVLCVTVMCCSFMAETTFFLPFLCCLCVVAHVFNYYGLVGWVLPCSWKEVIILIWTMAVGVYI